MENYHAAKARIAAIDSSLSIGKDSEDETIALELEKRNLIHANPDLKVPFTHLVSQG